jgi:hypothetical protein
MPNLDDNIPADLDPSTSPDLDVTLDPVSAAVEQPATSSPATGENDDLLSVVRDVVSESRKDPTASPAEGEENGQSTASGASKEPDDEKFSDVPFHKHPRFQQLLRQRDGLRQDADRYGNVQTFLDSHSLSGDEAANGLIIMGLMKTDPAEAWKQLLPVMKNLAIAAGEVLPDDLQQMVSAGRMDQAAALEVSRSRAGLRSMQTRQTFNEQRQQRTTQAEAVQALGRAAMDWEANRKAKDPNFASKSTLVEKEVAYLQRQEGVPNTPEGVRAMLDKAYKAVNATLKPVTPQPQMQRRPTLKPLTGGQVAGNQAPAPENMLDIVRANRRAR